MFELGRSMKVTGWITAFRDAGAVISEDAISEVARVIVSDHRSGARGTAKGRLRPSMMGEDCVRSHALHFLGAPKDPGVEAWEQMADTGSWLHYKWQAELLSGFTAVDGSRVDPLLERIEVQMEYPEFRLRGQCDGMLSDGALLEIKTLGKDKYDGRKQGSMPVKDWMAPPFEHVAQVDAYMLCTGAPGTHLVYVNRDSNDFREFYVPRSEERIAALRRRVLTPAFNAVADAIASRALPPMLEECVDEFKGRPKWCKVAGYCFAAKDAAHLVNGYHK